MILGRSLIVVAAVWAFAAPRTHGQATIEGRVELTKSRSAPVMTKRYEVVTKGGVLSTDPPLAVVYLEGSFAKAASLPKKQVLQKDLVF